MKNNHIFVLLLLIIASGCTGKNKSTDNTTSLSETLQAGSGTWKLIWSDEFDYVGLPDSTKWNFDVDGNDWGWGNNEQQWYTNEKRENAWVENGVLTITARKEKAGDKEYTSARLTTKNKGDWKYARVEVKAKLAGGRGTWSAIWMLPTDNVYGTWPNSGEIDIMEHIGYEPDSVFSTVHTVKYNHTINTQVGNIQSRPGVISDFHIYTLEWEEHEMRSYVDNELYFTFKNDKDGYEAWPFDQRFHLLLNLAVGGTLGGRGGIDDSSLPQKMEVDYVRIYEKVK